MTSWSVDLLQNYVKLHRDPGIIFVQYLFLGWEGAENSHRGRPFVGGKRGWKLPFFTSKYKTEKPSKCKRSRVWFVTMKCVGKFNVRSGWRLTLKAVLYTYRHIIDFIDVQSLEKLFRKKNLNSVRGRPELDKSPVVKPIWTDRNGWVRPTIWLFSFLTGEGRGGGGH